VRTTASVAAFVLLGSGLAGCSNKAHSKHDAAKPAGDVTSFGDGVRVNLVEGWVEFDAEVCAIDDPDVTVPLYLEQAVCSWNTREHESVFATDVRPSMIHAALLLAGREPGTPGDWAENMDGSLDPIQATGEPLTVTVLWTDAEGVSREEPLRTFVAFGPDADSDLDIDDLSFVFSGSRTVPGRRPTDPVEIYAADFEGTIVGLSSFGTETVAPTVLHHPDLFREPAIWIANFATIPAPRTGVRIRLSPIRN
jgi:hypothetical protein